MHAHEYIPVKRHFGKLRQRDDPALIKLDRSVQRKEHREHIGKAEPPVNAPAERCSIPKLYADNMAQRFAHRLALFVVPLPLLRAAEKSCREDCQQRYTEENFFHFLP